VIVIFLGHGFEGDEETILIINEHETMTVHDGSVFHKGVVKNGIAFAV
jgi:hypothetical protein